MKKSSRQEISRFDVAWVKQSLMAAQDFLKAKEAARFLKNIKTALDKIGQNEQDLAAITEAEFTRHKQKSSSLLHPHLARAEAFLKKQVIRLLRKTDTEELSDEEKNFLCAYKTRDGSFLHVAIEAQQWVPLYSILLPPRMRLFFIFPGTTPSFASRIPVKHKNKDGKGPLEFLLSTQHDRKQPSPHFFMMIAGICFFICGHTEQECLPPMQSLFRCARNSIFLRTILLAQPHLVARATEADWNACSHPTAVIRNLLGGKDHMFEWHHFHWLATGAESQPKYGSALLSCKRTDCKEGFVRLLQWINTHLPGKISSISLFKLLPLIDVMINAAAWSLVEQVRLSLAESGGYGNDWTLRKIKHAIMSRQWKRVIASPGAAPPSPACDAEAAAMVAFFCKFPGLRKLIGSILLCYYNLLNAESFPAQPSGAASPPSSSSSPPPSPSLS